MNTNTSARDFLTQYIATGGKVSSGGPDDVRAAEDEIQDNPKPRAVDPSQGHGGGKPGLTPAQRGADALRAAFRRL